MALYYGLGKLSEETSYYELGRCIMLSLRMQPVAAAWYVSLTERRGLNFSKIELLQERALQEAVSVAQISNG